MQNLQIMRIDYRHTYIQTVRKAAKDKKVF